MLRRDPAQRIGPEQIRTALLRCPRNQLGAPPGFVILPLSLEPQADDAPQIVGLSDLRAGGGNRCGLVCDRNVNDSPSRVSLQRQRERRHAHAGPHGLDDLVAVDDGGVRPAGPCDRPNDAAADFVARAEQDAHD